MDALVLVEEDEGEERLEQSRLSDAPQEEVEVRCGGHHLFQSQLHRMGGGQSVYVLELWVKRFIRLHVM